MESENRDNHITKEELTSAERPMNYTGLIPVFLLLVVVIARISYEIYKSNRQKTRVPQERRMYVGSRPRQSFAQQEPTIFVSPANLPPPPKYEAMAPPSYEEVVGIHYPNYQASALPITQPITSAMAQSSRSADNNVTNNANTDATVITVTADDRRTSVTVTASS
ncbi:uncharacterized protein LOC126377611 isoform X2 [Pectinophora gossypiella]|uniref:uncharacterized protein LOC126377611 isoform X2 n=1 Tax=Pectinophora gossypiella TaxID=13191 RepID=UPI00214EE771|nr:uncharacterized protein LOC126377611 isoform X2 [Pectinophora gossypiella]